MRFFITTILSFCLLSFATSVIAVDKTDQFPKRKFYPQLNYIETQEFAEGIRNNRFDVIDVRDVMSFNSLHVKVATNIVLTSETFDDEILAFAAKSKKPLAVYCNGISCSKSYIGSSKIIEIFKKHKIEKQVFTYDSGINAIAYAHNDMVLKDGKDISEENPLIAAEKIKKHMLEPQRFEEFIADHVNEDYAILDIREKNEKIINKLFMFQNEKNITLNQREKLIVFLNKIKQDDKTLLVYDASGRQIDGIYELLRIIEIDKWHYMEGGEFGYSKYAIKAAVL